MIPFSEYLISIVSFFGNPEYLIPNLNYRFIEIEMNGLGSFASGMLHATSTVIVVVSRKTMV